MPSEQNFWNPYSFAPIQPKKSREEFSPTHHHFAGVSGHLTCHLTNHTPFTIKSSLPNGSPVAEGKILPGTSLKGMLRSLAELIMGAPQPDSRSEGGEHLTLVESLFGCIGKLPNRGGDRIHLGKVRIGEAKLMANPKNQVLPNGEIRPDLTEPLTFVVGNPKDTHTAFYPGQGKGRKLYLHSADIRSQRQNTPGKQAITLRALKENHTYEFSVYFENLTEKELSLLLYILFLEQNLTVRWEEGETKNSIGPTFKGNMCHKLGYGKPHGLGTVEITPIKLETWNAQTRYQQFKPQVEKIEDEALLNYISTHTQTYRTDASETMSMLRKIMVYDPESLKQIRIQYPSFDWFRAHSQVPLKKI